MNAKCPKAAKTTKPEMKEKAVFADEITKELASTGASLGHEEPYAVKIPKVTPREKKI